MKILQTLPWKFYRFYHEDFADFTMKILKTLPWRFYSLYHEDFTELTIKILQTLPWRFYRLFHEDLTVFTLKIWQTLPWRFYWLYHKNFTDFTMKILQTLPWRFCRLYHEDFTDFTMKILVTQKKVIPEPKSPLIIHLGLSWKRNWAWSLFQNRMLSWEPTGFPLKEENGTVTLEDPGSFDTPIPKSWALGPISFFFVASIGSEGVREREPADLEQWADAIKSFTNLRYDSSIGNFWCCLKSKSSSRLPVVRLPVVVISCFVITLPLGLFIKNVETPFT